MRVSHAFVTLKIQAWGGMGGVEFYPRGAISPLFLYGLYVLTIARSARQRIAS